MDGLKYLKGFAASSSASSSKGQALATLQDKNSQNSIPLHLPNGASLSSDNVRVLAGSAGEIVIAHIKGGGLAEQSAVVTQIGHDSSVHTVETHFIPIDEQSGRIKQWVDGHFKIDKAISKEGAVIDRSDSIVDSGVVHPADWWDDMENCMENAGVPGWVFTGIWVACGVACALTAGGGCLACALGVAGIYGNEVAICIGA
ncbi:hypothetical protein [Streptomyces natalensis]|uniref:hypothetical protein n=1 Tax=Streptomyces natalensis TaxID=68242 RepID=UPI000ACADCE5|nr:hypothetical protein [Streptomyces natalensis]